MGKKFLICMAVLMALNIPLSAGSTFSLSLQGGFLFPGDAQFTEIYGGSQFVPGIKVQVNLANSLYIWGGFQQFSVSGTTPVLEADADASQRHIAVGAGWMIPFGAESKAGGYVEAGVLLVHLEEEAFGDGVEDDATGFRLATGLRYSFSKFLFAGAGLAYSSASKEIDQRAIKSGGFAVFVEAGLQL